VLGLLLHCVVRWLSKLDLHHCSYTACRLAVTVHRIRSLCRCRARQDFISDWQ